MRSPLRFTTVLGDVAALAHAASHVYGASCSTRREPDLEKEPTTSIGDTALFEELSDLALSHECDSVLAFILKLLTLEQDKALHQDVDPLKTYHKMRVTR